MSTAIVYIHNNQLLNGRGGPIPIELANYINLNQWNYICDQYTEAHRESTGFACCCEWLCCLCFVCPCIFCCHPCIEKSLLSNQLFRKLNSINSNVFSGYRVCEINSDIGGGLAFYLSRFPTPVSTMSLRTPVTYQQQMTNPSYYGSGEIMLNNINANATVAYPVLAEAIPISNYPPSAPVMNSKANPMTSDPSSSSSYAPLPPTSPISQHPIPSVPPATTRHMEIEIPLDVQPGSTITVFSPNNDRVQFDDDSNHFKTNSIRKIRVQFSTKPNEITPEQIIKGLEKVEQHKKFIRSTAGPKGFVPVMGTGKELHVPKNPSEIAALSGIPEEHAKRTCFISQRMNKTMQSMEKHSHQWQITWQAQSRWTNPLMGWTSSADPMTGLNLYFDTKEEAEAFAVKNGWKYETFEPHSDETVEPGTYQYQHNFLPVKIALILKKEGIKTKHFENPKYGQSNYFMPLTFHGDKEVVQFGPKPSEK